MSCVEESMVENGRYSYVEEKHIMLGEEGNAEKRITI